MRKACFKSSHNQSSLASRFKYSCVIRMIQRTNIAQLRNRIIIILHAFIASAGALGLDMLGLCRGYWCCFHVEKTDRFQSCITYVFPVMNCMVSFLTLILRSFRNVSNIDIYIYIHIVNIYIYITIVNYI